MFLLGFHRQLGDWSFVKVRLTSNIVERYTSTTIAGKTVVQIPSSNSEFKVELVNEWDAWMIFCMFQSFAELQS